MCTACSSSLTPTCTSSSLKRSTSSSRLGGRGARQGAGAAAAAARAAAACSRGQGARGLHAAICTFTCWVVCRSHAATHANQVTTRSVARSAPSPPRHDPLPLPREPSPPPPSAVLPLRPARQPALRPPPQVQSNRSPAGRQGERLDGRHMQWKAGG